MTVSHISLTTVEPFKTVAENIHPVMLAWFCSLTKAYSLWVDRKTHRMTHTRTHTHTHEQFLQLTVGSRLHTAEGSRQTATILLSNVQSTFFKREAGVNELNQYPAALTVLWHCWLDVRNSIRPVQNWVMRCCLKQSANDLQCSTDVIATPSSLASLKSIMVYRYLSCANLSQLSWKRPLGVCFLGRNVNEKASN